MTAITRDLDQPFASPRHLIEQAQIFRFIPNSAAGKDALGFFRRTEQARIASVVNDKTIPGITVICSQRFAHGRAWRRDHLYRCQSGPNARTVFVILGGRIFLFDRAPPRQNARMCGENDGNTPPQEAVAVAVEVNKIGLQAFREVEQPLAGAIDIIPGIVHPFQAIIAFKKPKIFQARDLLMLSGSKSRAHSGEEDLDAVRLERAR